MDLSGLYIKGTGSYEVKEIALEQGNLNSGNFTIESEVTESPAGTFTWIGNSGDGTIWILENDVMDVGKSYKISFDTVEFVRAGFASVKLAYVEPDSGDATLDDNGVQFYEIGHHVYTVNYANSGTGTGRLQIQLEDSIDGDHLVINNIKVEEIPSLPSLDKGSTYLECLTAGTVAFPSDAAYGEWEFSYYKSYDTNDASIVIISDVIDTSGTEIQLRIINNERVALMRGAAYLFYTSVSYIDLYTWYRFKVTRTLDGQFTVYIKGGDFGINGWTMIDSIESGSNPATETLSTSSKYVVLEFDNNSTGDRISNITVKKKGRFVIDDPSVVSGEWIDGANSGVWDDGANSGVWSDDI